MLQRASHLDPSNPEILLRLGHIQGLCYDYAAAERCFEQALRLASRKGVMLTAIAEHCRDFRNPALAERYLRKALEVLEQTNVWPPTGLELARLCERTRRLPEATQLVDRVLAAVPTYPAALLLRARLERTAGRLEAAEQVLRSFITKPVPLVWTHAQAWYELATVLDRQEKYDEAMTAFFNAKSLLQPQAPGYLQALKQTRAYLKVMEENVSAEQLRRWFENGPALPPSRRLALLCGHARSGTTLLEQVLDAHPDIVSVEESPDFFERRLSSGQTQVGPERPHAAGAGSGRQPGAATIARGLFSFHGTGDWQPHQPPPVAGQESRRQLFDSGVCPHFSGNQISYRPARSA